MTIATAASKDILRREALQKRGALGPGVREAFSARLVEQGLAIAQRVGVQAGSAFRAAGLRTVVGIAYSAAQAPAIPDEPHEQRLDFILTERELIDCRGG